MQFGADDVQAADLAHALAQLDVRTTPRHVGSDGHPTQLAGVGHDFRFVGDVSGVEHHRLQSAFNQQLSQVFALVDRPRANQHGPILLVLLVGIFDDGCPLLIGCTQAPWKATS